MAVQTLREWAMLWTIFVILLVLWLLGVVSSYTLGGFVHVLLVVAIVVALIHSDRGAGSLQAAGRCSLFKCSPIATTIRRSRRRSSPVY